jgi:NADPH2:quinone reductase
MNAIGFRTSLPIADQESFISFDAPRPSAQGQDLLVKIKAVSVNPVDYKVRQNSAKDTVLEQPKIIGYDASGVVEAVGENVTLFKVGDEVYYAGDITRPGSNAEYQLVDERIVGKKPSSLSFEEAAAIPLTAITAWELLFDRMRITKDRDQDKTILMLAGAGGVGSIAIQLAKKLAGLNVIATASRAESIEWCKNMGADLVVDHRDLLNAVRNAGYQHVPFIADFVDNNGYWDTMVELIQPQGHISSITGNANPVALTKLKTKSASFSWEYMFTRSSFKTDDMIEQHHILNKVADMIDEKAIQGTVTTVLDGLTVENLKAAHQQLESGKTIGKLVIKY